MSIVGLNGFQMDYEARGDGDDDMGIPQSALWIVPYGAHGPIFGTMALPFAASALAHLSGENAG